WHFARGLAFASTGKLDEAEAEHKFVAEAEEKTPPDAIFQMPINNKTKDILKIAENVLGAKISLAKGDMDATVNQLRAAVAVQDSLKYDEPQDWFYPVRESLGAVLLKIGDDAGAEETFRADLDRNPLAHRRSYGCRPLVHSLGVGIGDDHAARRLCGSVYVLLVDAVRRSHAVFDLFVKRRHQEFLERCGVTFRLLRFRIRADHAQVR